MTIFLRKLAASYLCIVFLLLIYPVNSYRFFLNRRCLNRRHESSGGTGGIIRRFPSRCPLLLSEKAPDFENPKYQLSFRIHEGLSQISREKWNHLLTSKPGNPSGQQECNNDSGTSSEDAPSPFLQYDWLNLLEESGCATANRGWQPLHVVAYLNSSYSGDSASTGSGSPTHYSDNDSTIVAAMPLYAKYHSRGEFIFDQSWAEYAERAIGIQYYPKLLSAVPFTPASGSRLLMDKQLYATPSEQQTLGQYFANFIKQLALMNKLSSVNANFMIKDEVSYFLPQGYNLRETVQYRWENFNTNSNTTYSSFDDYLSCFKSKRRSKIKKERRNVYEQEKIRVEVVPGDSSLATEAFYLRMYELYTTTVDKMWGLRYLSPEFFSQLAASDPEFRKHLVFIVAYDEKDELIAGTINMVSATHFYGRYWGTYKYVNNLHFEVCYYKAIDYCIEHGIKYLEPGAGGGEFKFLRGFNPFIVSSVHWFSSSVLAEAVGDFLEREREVNRENADYLLANSALGNRAIVNNE